MFQGRSTTPSIRLHPNSDLVSKALEVNEELLNFLQVKNTSVNLIETAEEKAAKKKEKIEENEQMEEYEEELEEDQY